MTEEPALNRVYRIEFSEEFIAGAFTSRLVKIEKNQWSTKWTFANGVTLSGDVDVFTEVKP